MRLPPLSVRARLTLWHAGVLTLIICVFSAGIFLFVGARLYAGLDTQLAREIGTISRVYREEPEELKDLAPHWGITLFQIEAGGSIRHQTEAWEREGLSQAVQTGNSGRRFLGPRRTAVTMACTAFLNHPIALRPPSRKTPFGTRCGRVRSSSRQEFRSRLPWRSVEATSLPVAYSLQWVPWQRRRVRSL